MYGYLAQFPIPTPSTHSWLVVALEWSYMESIFTHTSSFKIKMALLFVHLHVHFCSASMCRMPGMDCHQISASCYN